MNQPANVWIGTSELIRGLSTALSTVAYYELSLTNLLLVDLAFRAASDKDTINLPLILQFTLTYIPEGDPGLERVRLATMQLACHIHEFYTRHSLWGRNGTSPYSLLCITLNQDCVAGIALPHNGPMDETAAMAASGIYPVN